MSKKKSYNSRKIGDKNPVIKPNDSNLKAVRNTLINSKYFYPIITRIIVYAVVIYIITRDQPIDNCNVDLIVNNNLSFKTLLGDLKSDSIVSPLNNCICKCKSNNNGIVFPARDYSLKYECKEGPTYYSLVVPGCEVDPMPKALFDIYYFRVRLSKLDTIDFYKYFNINEVEKLQILRSKHFHNVPFISLETKEAIRVLPKNPISCLIPKKDSRLTINRRFDDRKRGKTTINTEYSSGKSIEEETPHMQFLDINSDTVLLIASDVKEIIGRRGKLKFTTKDIALSKMNFKGSKYEFYVDSAFSDKAIYESEYDLFLITTPLNLRIVPTLFREEHYNYLYHEYYSHFMKEPGAGYFGFTSAGEPIYLASTLDLSPINVDSIKDFEIPYWNSTNNNLEININAGLKNEEYTKLKYQYDSIEFYSYNIYPYGLEFYSYSLDSSEIENFRNSFKDKNSEREFWINFNSTPYSNKKGNEVLARFKHYFKPDTFEKNKKIKMFKATPTLVPVNSICAFGMFNEISCNTVEAQIEINERKTIINRPVTIELSVDSALDRRNDPIIFPFDNNETYRLQVEKISEIKLNDGNVRPKIYEIKIFSVLAIVLVLIDFLIKIVKK